MSFPTLYPLKYDMDYIQQINLVKKYIAAFDKPQAVLPQETEDAGSVHRVSTSGPSSARTGAIEVNENQKRGMILPFEPHSLTFDDVRYSVDMPAVG